MKVTLEETQFKDLIRLFNKFHKEAEKCFECKAYLATCVIAAAELEAMLLVVADLFESETKEAIKKLKLKQKDITKFGLYNLLQIAFKAGWIPFSGVEKPSKSVLLGDWLLNYVKELRNWIHPGKKIREYTGMRITKKRAEVVLKLVEETREILLQKITRSIMEELKKEIL